MFAPLRLVLQRVVRHGRLTIIDGAGDEHHFGPANFAGPPGALPDVEIVIRIADRATERAMARDPYLAFGEAYMDGRVSMLEGSIYDALALVMRGGEGAALPKWIVGLDRLRHGTRRIAQYNPAARSRRNVEHHYDIDGSIYDLFLDTDRQYSCAYFPNGDKATIDLETAQLLKKRHIAAKLVLRPGHTVLDIGCGWGGLGLYLADMCHADVTGVTLSSEQLDIARQRSSHAGLTHSPRFEAIDYRALKGRYDRIVSVGMFEHVGINHYDEFFEKIAGLLEHDGIALLHTIGRSDGPGHTNPFIAKYIFPGGYFPALSEILPAIERAGLVVSDIEVLRLHYAETLKAWRERFLASRDKAVAVRGQAFARMWEFYLAASEAAFRYQGLVVFQIQLVRDINTQPLTRDYIAAAEQMLFERERQTQTGVRLAGE
jgi:cyclopropane-fatty-acyl-phospholipid synthase